MGHRRIHADHQIQLGDNPSGGCKTAQASTRGQRCETKGTVTSGFCPELKIVHLRAVLPEFVDQSPEDLHRQRAFVKFAHTKGVRPWMPSGRHQPDLQGPPCSTPLPAWRCEISPIRPDLRQLIQAQSPR